MCLVCVCVCCRFTGNPAEQIYGPLVFYIIADMNQTSCLFPAPHNFDEYVQYCTWQQKHTRNAMNVVSWKGLPIQLLTCRVSAPIVVVSVPPAKDQCTGKIKTFILFFFIL